MVQVPGAGAGDAQAAATVARDSAEKPRHTCCPTGSNDAEPGSSEDPARRCAICYLNGVLDTPPPIDLPLVHSGWALLGRPVVPPSPAMPDPHRPYSGRAPPLSFLRA